MKIAYNHGMLPLVPRLVSVCQVVAARRNPELTNKLALRCSAMLEPMPQRNAGMIADKDQAAKPGASTSISADYTAAAPLDGAVGSAGADNHGIPIESAGESVTKDSTARISSADSSTAMPQAGKSEEDLMLEYARGDTQAFTYLYTKYRPPLFRFFVAALHNESLATELYQETWTKVIGASGSYQPKAKFSTWLFTIARNSLHDYYRKFQPHLIQFDTVAEDAAADETYAIDSSVVVEMQPDEIAALAQQSKTLQLALDRLPLKQKEVMLLRYFAGMSVADIADSTEEKPETVKSRLRYATLKLKQDLKYSLAAQIQVK